MPIEVLIEHGDWQNADVERLANMTFAEVMDYFGYDPELYEVSLLACDDSRIAGLNGEFRAKKYSDQCAKLALCGTWSHRLRWVSEGARPNS